MTKTFFFFFFLVTLSTVVVVHAWTTTTLSSSTDKNTAVLNNRRQFLTQTLTVATTASLFPVLASASSPPPILTTASGIQYAVLQPPQSPPASQKGDIVAIEYTGYLTNGKIFDNTHGSSGGRALVFELGGNGVIDGINEMVATMGVGEKRQVIVPPNLAFGKKGICVEKKEKEECLIPPDSTLVYDIFLKRTAIPPP